MVWLIRLKKYELTKDLSFFDRNPDRSFLQTLSDHFWSDFKTTREIRDFCEISILPKFIPH